MNTAVEAYPPEFSYHLLRAALDTFKKNVAALDATERSRAERKARQTYVLEDLVMASAEAAEVVIAADQVARAVEKVESRYPSTVEYEDDLSRNGLDPGTLRSALRRELVFDAVLQKIGARHAAVDDIDVALFYEMHRDRFAVAETRRTRHILITVNDRFAENQREAALTRAEDLAGQVRGRSHRFASVARRHSECPTAMEGGKLGRVSRGQLYPQLDEVLFSMDDDEISGVVESDLGYHILWCERIEPARTVPLAQARSRIRGILEERGRRNCQKAWLSELKQRAEVLQ